MSLIDLLSSDVDNQDVSCVSVLRAWMFQSATLFYDKMFQSTTEFYGKDMNLSIWFGLFCFNYSLAGIMMLLTKPKWTQKCRWFPYTSFALVLVFVQGPLSFLADYMHLTEDSVYTVVDRFMATFNMVLELWKILLMVWYNNGGVGSGSRRPSTIVLYILLTIGAVISIMNSQHAQRMVDRDQFIFWHSIWHLYPLFGSIIIGMDHYTSTNTTAFSSEEEDLDGDTTPPSKSSPPVLLSTYLMEQLPVTASSNKGNPVKNKIQ